MEFSLFKFFDVSTSTVSCVTLLTEKVSFALSYMCTFLFRYIQCIHILERYDPEE